MSFNLDTYAVIGNPIAHSKSPDIHRAFARQTGQALVYQHRLAPLDGFVSSATDFFHQGGRGLNVTVPFKIEAFDFSQTRTPRAQAAGAVNTLWGHKGMIHGDNTDGIGLVRDLTQNLGLSLRGKRLLVLGAGGAVRGVLLPLLEQQPDVITLANRSLEKAQNLAHTFHHHGTIQVCSLDALPEHNDLVLNATSAGLQGVTPNVPAECFAPGAWAYDMLYGARPTPFLCAAQGRAAHQADGLGMLVEQAAEAFFIWRGVRPETIPVIDQLRANLLLSP